MTKLGSYSDKMLEELLDTGYLSVHFSYEEDRSKLELSVWYGEHWGRCFTGRHDVQNQADLKSLYDFWVNANRTWDGFVAWLAVTKEKCLPFFWTTLNYQECGNVDFYALGLPPHPADEVFRLQYWLTGAYFLDRGQACYRVPRHLSSATDFSFLVNETGGWVTDDDQWYEFYTIPEAKKMLKYLKANSYMGIRDETCVIAVDGINTHHEIHTPFIQTKLMEGRKVTINKREVVLTKDGYGWMFKNGKMPPVGPKKND